MRRWPRESAVTRPRRLLAKLSVVAWLIMALGPSGLSAVAAVANAGSVKQLLQLSHHMQQLRQMLHGKLC
jgi:hypothetical protein